MGKQVDVITMPTSLGDAEARRVGTDPTGDIEWAIGYPWGDARFYGTVGQVKAEMARNIGENDVADEAEVEQTGPRM